MIRQEDVHVFQGMRRDSHPIKQDKSFLWDAHNIRLTTREGDTFMSLTNEKSTKELIALSSEEKYIGHTTIGDYLILFVSADRDIIYRIDLNTLTKEILYIGELNLDPAHPAQIISSYEAELVQKIYWVDGINSPRVINIAKPELVKAKYDQNIGYSDIYTDAPFDFVQDLELKEEVSIEKMQSSAGVFPSGVLQYALTYLHKYGQESNIFYVSEPLYLSYSDRGGSPEDRISTSFKITVKNIDKKFQYIRVYSIIRTSIDSTPTVTRVIDFDTSSVTDTEISIIDNNTTGDTVDPTFLLYVGGKAIIANCIATKDNTLFLGDITYNRKSIFDLGIRGDNLKMYPAMSIATERRDISLPTQDIELNYANQLSGNTATFKNGETYRLGCRFQYKTGEWSEPIWIDDKEYNYSSLGYSNEKLHLGKLVGTIPESIKNTLLNGGYKRVQALIVQPSYRDRTILAQGILCPTVGNVGNRIQGGGAWAQSSWLLRPWSSQPDGDGYKGSTPACKHDTSLAFGSERCVELQNMAIMFNDDSVVPQMTYKEMVGAKTENGATEGYYGAFVVDQSIVTMHSPDIEFGDIDNLLDSEIDLELYKVGEVVFNLNKGEIDIQTATPVADPDAAGFIKRSLSGEGQRSLISGLFYEDSMVNDSDGGKKIDKYRSSRLWMTYMWHRTGSLNNDCVRPDGVGTRTSELKKKVITNLKTSSSTSYLTTATKLPLLDIKSFNNDELALVRLRRNDNGSIKSATYFGNVDTLIPAYMQYSYMCTANSVANLKVDTATFSGTALVLGESKAFSNLIAKSMKGSNTSVLSENVQGSMPYIVETQTVIESNVSTSSSSSSSSTSSSGSGGTVESNTDTGNDSNTSSDSNTTITSTGTKTVMVNITGKARFEATIIGGKFQGTVTLLQDATATDGTVVSAGYSWSISGETSFQPSVKKYSHTWLGTGSKHPRWSDTTPLFTSATQSIDAAEGEGGGIENAEDIGDNYEALKLSKDGIRMKYKSTPHAVISLESALSPLSTSGSLYLVELRQNPGTLRYGGNTIEALRNNLWIPAGPSLPIENGKVEWIWGDTWYQKYDCLKTYPFTFEDINQVIEIGSFYCETRVNMDGRYDRNRGSTSFTLSPTNFNLVNPVYSQLDTFFTSRVLDDDYYKVSDYPNQFLWTEAKFPAAESDSWTNLHLANSYDMDGSNGRLISILPFNDLLIGFQERAVSQILFNNRVQVQASDGFPVELANSQKVTGVRAYSNNIGCQDKFSMVTTPMGIYFIDNSARAIYKFDGQLTNISYQLGHLYWVRENYANNSWMYKSNKDGNPGIRIYYDSKYQDVYFTPSLTLDGSAPEALCFSEQLGQFTSMMSYGGAVMFSWRNKFLSLANNPTGRLTLWENFTGTDYNNIFGVVRPFSFSFISNDNPTVTKIFDTIEFRADLYDKISSDRPVPEYEGFSGTNQVGKPFSFIRVSNEYQDTGNVQFTNNSLRKKFRIWRGIIPRNGMLERIRNPWAKVTLGMTEPSNKMMILHDLSVKYTM